MRESPGQQSRATGKICQYESSTEKTIERAALIDWSCNSILESLSKTYNIAEYFAFLQDDQLFCFYFFIFYFYILFYQNQKVIELSVAVNNNESIQLTLSRREDGDGVGGKEFCFGDSSTIAKHQSEQTGSLLAV